MIGYDPWHWGESRRETRKPRKKTGGSVNIHITINPPGTSEREALTDIAYDTGTLEAAQKRAREALAPPPDGR